MLEAIEARYRQAAAELEALGDGDGLRAWEAATLGKKGWLTEALRAIGSIAPEGRAAYGKRVNEIKQGLLAAYEAREALA